MTGWYRRFIQNYAQTAAPLHDYLKKNRIKKFELSEEAIKAFEHLKTSMATCHVLITPDFKKPFTINTAVLFGTFGLTRKWESKDMLV